MAKKNQTAITPTRSQDFAEWYIQVVKSAQMAEHSPVKGCMIIKPWGYGIWDKVKNILDKRIKETGHENCYFPLFIPMSLIEREADHVEGFAKEMAVVTHSRMTQKDGHLVPDGELEEPLIVRPTSETIIGEAFANWIDSYRDLPLLINQWANVVRMELRPRLFLRTTEFLWQEGHTAHVSAEEAQAEASKMLEVYRVLVEESMAIPVICGHKTDGERFPGAVDTQTIEAMMQDGKALQAGTSHYLGQNFAKAANIRFQNQAGEMAFVHTTSWGVSTRLIGALIMTHSDDDGLRVPPKIAPQQVVIIPILRGEGDDDVRAYADKIKEKLAALTYAGEPIRAKVDTREYEPVKKRWAWIKKGVPIICEVGPRDLEKEGLAFVRRDQLDQKKAIVSLDNFCGTLEKTLGEIQQALFDQAKDNLDSRLKTDITTYEDFAAYFKGRGESYDENPGFVRAKFADTPAAAEQLKELGVTVRCLPFDQDHKPGTCIITGEETTVDAIFAKAY